MPSVDIVVSTSTRRTPRVKQVEGIFDVPPSDNPHRTWRHTLPFEERPWQVGLIVGPSGSGKSTLARHLFGERPPFSWHEDRAVVDDFPEMPIRQVSDMLSSVGFSSPPSWLRPYASLSTGEQFRASVARALCGEEDPIVIDEFTSVVDRGVAHITSLAVAKAVRRTQRRMVAVTCHYDVADWLQPDWTYELASETFTWGSVQRPLIEVEVYPATTEAWRWFRPHHYLSGSLSRSALCWVATVDGAPAAFASSLYFPHPRVRDIYREHRTVCLPDFQGAGIGNRLSELVASVHRAAGYRFRSVTSSPAMIRHRARSPLWRMDRNPSLVTPTSRSSTVGGMAQSTLRSTASFEYVGPRSSDEQLRALWTRPTARAARERVPAAPKAARRRAASAS